MPPHGNWRRGKPRAHVHPSVNCYKVHRCRCEECTELHRKVNKAERARRKAREQAGLPSRPGHNPDQIPSKRIPQVLDEKELARVRAMVGFKPDKDYGQEDYELWLKEKRRFKGFYSSLRSLSKV